MIDSAIRTVCASQTLGNIFCDDCRWNRVRGAQAMSRKGKDMTLSHCWHPGNVVRDFSPHEKAYIHKQTEWEINKNNRCQFFEQPQPSLATKVLDFFGG